MLPLILPINQDSLKLIRDDDRKVILTILADEADEKSKELIKVLKSAASANRDLVFGYVGLKQFEEFVESFGVYKKTPLPKMIVWDGDEEYFTVSDSFISQKPPDYCLCLFIMEGSIIYAFAVVSLQCILQFSV